MDIPEFRRLTLRVAATRSSETRAFLKAFDLVPGRPPGVGADQRDWRMWSGANNALRGAVNELEAFLGADGS